MDTQTTLPPSTEMMERLRSVTDDPYIDEKLYPRVVKELADMSMTGMGISLALTRAISEYANDMPPILTKAAYSLYEGWITAIVDDMVVRDEALATARQAGVITD